MLEHFAKDEPVVISGSPVQDDQQDIGIGHEVIIHESGQAGQGKDYAAQQQIRNQFFVIEQLVLACDKIGCDSENHGQQRHQQVR